MYVQYSTGKVRTFVRAQVPKITASLPEPNHLLEDLLSRRWMRKLLGWLTTRDRDGRRDHLDQIDAARDRLAAAVADSSLFAWPS